MIERPIPPESPRIHVSFLGREYTGRQGAETFQVTSTLTNIFDGWSLNLPIGPQGQLEDLPGLNLQRWIPVKLSLSDPEVDNGKPVPMLMGLITHVDHECSDGASVLTLSGYDLGKLLDSAARPWIRLRGVTFDKLLTTLLDPSWLAANRTDGWGIQGTTGLNRDRFIKRGVRVLRDRAQIELEVNKKYKTIMPPLQTEVGETVYDIFSRAARLTGLTKSAGSFVSVSADGYIQIFNPDDYRNDKALYVFEDHVDKRNLRIKRSKLVLDGEDLYTEYDCYGSVIYPPGKFAVDQVKFPNAGRFFGQSANSILGPSENRIFRRLTFSDPEQYQRGFAQVRADWRRRQSLYKETSIQFTIQGLSMPGPDGVWRPLVEGNIAEVNSGRLRIQGKYIIEQIVKRQNATEGTVSDVTLRPLGLLGV